MTMITPSYLGETIEYSSLHACRSTLEDPTAADQRRAEGRRHPPLACLRPQGRREGSMRPGARLAAAVATAVALDCLPAAAQQEKGRTFYSGNDLWSHCSDKSAFSSGLCLGYVNGIADAMMTGSGILGRRACLPLPVTTEQAQAVVTRYLEQHPEARHHPAASSAAAALEEAFPCKP